MKKALLLGLVYVVLTPAWSVADPPVIVDTPNVFCLRITDIERIDPDSFAIEYEVLNWTGTEAAGLQMSLTQATSPGVTIGSLSIDPDGRGGTPAVPGEIGGGVFDATAVHSGRGRGDIAGALNDWVPNPISSSQAEWNAGINDNGTPGDPFDDFLNGTAIPNRDLIGAIVADGGNTTAALPLIPGPGLDATGDSAIDGGPGPYAVSGSSDDSPGTARPEPDYSNGDGNSLDGLVMQVDNWDPGELLSLNWFLLGFERDQPALNGAPPSDLFPIGTGSGGNAFGFGTLNLALQNPGDEFPGPIFEGNTGLGQPGFLFYDDVANIPNPAQISGELGAGQTAPFLNPGDNTFGAPITTSLLAVPEPTTCALCLMGLIGLGFCTWRRIRRAA